MKHWSTSLKSLSKGRAIVVSGIDSCLLWAASFTRTYTHKIWYYAPSVLHWLSGRCNERGHKRISPLWNGIGYTHQLGSVDYVL